MSTLFPRFEWCHSLHLITNTSGCNPHQCTRLCAVVPNANLMGLLQVFAVVIQICAVIDQYKFNGGPPHTAKLTDFGLHPLEHRKKKWWGLFFLSLPVLVFVTFFLAAQQGV